MHARGRWHITLVLAALAGAVGFLHCGGGSGGSSQPQPDFSLTVSSPPSTIMAGGSGTLTVGITRSNGENQAITLSLATAPAGISGAGTIAASSATGPMTLQVAGTVQPNDAYSLTIQGTDGTSTHTAQTTLAVEAAAAPGTPAGLYASAAPGTVTLTWQSETTATTYNLYWSNSASVAPGNGTQIAGLTTPSYVQTVPTDGLAYYYVVTGVNALGESAPSAVVQAVPVAAPTVLAPAQNGPYGMALANGALYWLNSLDGTLMTVAAAGGAPATLVTGIPYPPNGFGGNPIASDGTNVYWTNAKTGEVAQVDIATQVVTSLYPGSTGETALGLAIDAHTVYWADTGGGALKAVPIGGGSVTTLLTEHDDVQCVAVDATNLYYSDPTLGTVNAVNLTTKALTVLASGLASPGFLAVDAVNVYWADALQNALYAIPINVTPAPGTPSLLTSGTVSYGGSVVVHAGFVYWIDASGYIRKIPTAGGTVTTLGSGPGGPCLAVDATRVYWPFLSSGLAGGTINAAPN